MNRRELGMRTLAAALVCAAAAWAWWRLLGPVPTLTRIAPSVLIVALAGWFGTAGGRRVTRGLGTIVALGATFGCGLIFGAMTIPSSSGSVDPGAFVRGVVQGIGILLTSAVPAAVDAETVTAAIIFSGYLTTVACVLVWTRAPATSLIPAFLLFLGATALSQGSTESPLTSGIIFAGACLLMLALVPKSGYRGAITDGAQFVEPQRERTPGRYIYATTTGLFIIAMTLAAYQLAMASGVGTSRPPFDPHQSGNYRPKTDINAVAQVQKWQTVDRKNKTLLFTVTGGALTSAVWWATSESYDGADWISRRSYDNVDEVLPYRGARRSMSRPVAGAVITTEKMVGPWLPNVHCVLALTGTTVRANDQCDIVPRSDDAAGLSYQFRAWTLAPANLAVLDRLRKADPGGATVASELPSGFPADLADFADSVMDSSESAYTQLSDLAAALGSSDYTVGDANTYNPFTYQAISQFVADSKRGSQAQYATAFALMARYKGYSTRLATGFALPTARGGRITPQRAIVWPEVKLTQAGWVPFAPGPPSAGVGVPVPSAYKPTPKPKPKPAPQPQPEPEPQPPPTPPATTGLPTWILGIGAVGALVAIWLVGVAAWRRHQRRRLVKSSDESRFGPWTWMRAVRRHCRVPVPVSPGSVIRGEPLTNSRPKRIRRTKRGQAPPVDTDSRTSESVSTELHSLALITQPALYGPTPASQTEQHTAWQLTSQDVSSVTTRSMRTRLRWWLIPMRVKSDDNGGVALASTAPSADEGT